jgi:hypothetical protein
MLPRHLTPEVTRLPLWLPLGGRRGVLRGIVRQPSASGPVAFIELTAGL